MNKKQKRLAYFDDILYTKLIINHVVTFLPSISLMSLVRAFPLVRSKLSDSVYSIIRRKIFTFCGNSIERSICDYEGCGVFTGGLLLCALLEDEWCEGSSDIDICFQCANPERYIRLEVRNYETNACFGTYPYSKHIVGVHNCILVSDDDDNAKPVQFIRLKTTPKEYVAGFDMDFCKNMFLRDKIIVMNPRSILHKQCTLNLDDSYLRYGLMNSSHLMDLSLPKIYQRLEKYIERGFDIAFTSNCITQQDIYCELINMYIDTELIDSNTTHPEKEYLQSIGRRVSAGIIPKKEVKKYVPKRLLRQFCLNAANWIRFWNYRIDPHNLKLICNMIPQHAKIENDQYKKKFI